MPEAISIDALLRLKTGDAVKQLESLGKNQKPITIPVKFDANKIGSIFAEITSSAISSKLKSSFDTIGDDLVTKIEDAFSKAKVRTKGGGLLGSLTNIVTAPLKGIATGAFEGVGREVSRKLGMGVSKGLDSQVSQFIGSFDLLGEKLITKIVPDLTDSTIALVKETSLGKQLAEVMKDLDIDEARENLKQRFKDLLGDSDLLIEQEFARSQKLKVKSQKRRTAQKEVGRQLQQELKLQPQTEFRSENISKQIKTLEKQSQQERSRLRQIAKIAKPSPAVVKQIETLIANLKSREKEIEKLQSEQKKLFKPEAQEKLAKLGVDTRSVDAVILSVDRTTEAAKKTLEAFKQSESTLRKDLNFASSELPKQQQRLEKLQQAAKQALSDNEIALARAIATKIVESKANIAKLQKTISSSADKLKTVISKQAQAREIIDSEREQKLILSLQQQIEIIQKVTSKSASEITKAIAVGQQQTLNKVIERTRKQAENQVKTIKSAIAKGSTVNESTIKQGESEIATTALGKLIAQRREIETATQQLLKEKIKLSSQRNQGQDVEQTLKTVELDLEEKVKQLTEVRTSLQKAESENFADYQKVQEIETQKSILKTAREAAKNLQLAVLAVENVNVNAQNEVARLNSRLREVVNATSLITKERTRLLGKPQKLDMSASKVLRRKQKIESSEPQKIVNAIAKQVEKISQVTFDSIPEIKVNPELLEGVAGAFNRKQNAIKISPDLFSKLNTESLDREIVEFIAHELRHAIQFQLAQSQQGIDKLISSSNFLLQPTAKEAKIIDKFVEGSVANAKGRLSKEQVRALEEDAYTFAYRYTEQIQNNITSLNKQLEKLLSTLKPIDLPKTPAISSRAFPVLDNSSQLQQLLEKQISASGLKELTKRLGLGTDSPIKKVAIERIVSSYKQDAIKVQELIARFGDDIRLKAAKTSAGSSFGKIDDEPALAEAFKANQRILKQAYDRLNNLSGESRQALAKQRNEIATEQIQTVDKITREFKVGGKTAQSLSGTRSQLTNINDSVINITKGISVGINKEARKVEKEGHELGEAFNKGFRESQGIKSPALERIKDMKLVALGIAIGVEHNIRRALRAGKRLGDSLSDGFIKSNIARGKIADKAAKQIEKQVRKLEKQNEKAAQATIGRIKQNLKTAEQTISTGFKQLDRAQRKTEAESQRRIAQTQTRIFKNQGIGDSPIRIVGEDEQKGAFSQIKTAIASMQNDLRNAGFEKANKEAKRTVSASKDLLSRLKTSVIVGEDAATKVRQANAAIVRLEREQRKIIKGIGQLKGADKRLVKARVERIQSQIGEEQERIAALKAQQREAQKLLPVYKQLIAIERQLQKAIANRDIRNIRRLNREISQVFANINQPPPTSPGGGFLGVINRQLEKIGITGKTVIRSLKGIAALAVGSIFIGGFDDALRQITEVTMRFEQLEKSIEFTAGSTEAGAKSLKFLRNEASRLKIDVEVATQSFKGLAAAARGTSLEKETQQIFSSVAQASRVFGLTAEQTQGTLLAITQIISKGTVQAEELRGQLGERLPGAFQIAARSMNVTTAELGKLLETGQVAADEFLPKFIAQLEKETRLGLAESLRTTSAAVTEVKNQFKLLQVEIGKTSQGATAATLTVVAKALELVRNNLNIVLPVIKTTALLLTLALLPSALMLGKFLTGLAVKGLNQVIGLLGITNGQLLATNAQLTLLATTSPKIALLVGTLTKLQVVLKLIAATMKAFVVIETISVLTDTFSKVSKAGREAILFV